MSISVRDIVNLDSYPLEESGFRAQCKHDLEREGVVVLPAFLRDSAIASIHRDGVENQHLAYYTTDKHNIYLAKPDPAYASLHPRNREVRSSKGCITTDQIPTHSALHSLYDAPAFREFLGYVLDEDQLYEYADNLSSINLHYASEGQELGWHFDNSSFAITLMIQQPIDGGQFEYVRDVRDAQTGDMNFALSRQVLNGDVTTRKLSMKAGTLVLFRGRNSMHRVTPVAGKRDRMLVVLAYNTQPGVALSESARMTFFGRLS